MKLTLKIILNIWYVQYLVLDVCYNKVDEIDDNVHDNVEVDNNFENNLDNMMVVDDNCISYCIELTQNTKLKTPKNCERQNLNKVNECRFS